MSQEQIKDEETQFIWTRKHLLGLRDLSKEELLHIFETADGFSDLSQRTVKKAPVLRGKLVVNLFFEDSTRTRSSFSLAASRLSADVMEFTAKSSSISKGETLRDTARNLEAMGIDIVICRHSAGGAPHLLSESINACIVNAGDGYHEHPTQGLLDLYTIREMGRSFEGLKVAIVGDIAHSRVARSNIWALNKLGAKVFLVGPPTLMPSAASQLPVTICHDFDEILPELDVVNMLRIQFERIKSHAFPSVREYSRMFALTGKRMERAKSDLIVMHPGPINRGVEIESNVADGPNSTILRQVTNGVTIRMAVLYLVNQAAVAEREA
ncbi:MAG: aspartate carbamoyltransferase catalytic subunit [Sedimentisphaerales bacterium]|nr:aspartate carbamoyltransferase catalytic subunit [Sedimentisphaerales bacterium]